MYAKGKKPIPKHLFNKIHPTLNGDKKLENYSGGSHEKFWWLCDQTFDCGCEHSWNASIDNIVRGSGCPHCCKVSKKFCKHKSLLYTHPELCKQWHPTLNGKLKPENITFGSVIPIWWICYNNKICDCLHEWINTPNHRTSKNKYNDGRGCPFCCTAVKQICIHQSLFYLRKDLMEEWDYEKNEIDPKKITPNSHKKANWKCLKNKNHKWEVIVKNRHRAGDGCPHCKNKTEEILYDFLIENYKNIEKQFKPDWCKNKETNKHLPFDFYIEKLKLLIELDGPHHLKQVSNWNSPEQNQRTDKYKMKLALENGISIIRILQEDVYYNKYDWKSELLKYIKLYLEPQIFYLCKNNEYDVYLNDDNNFDSNNKNEIVFPKKKSKIIFEDDKSKNNSKIKKKKIIFEDD